MIRSNELLPGFKLSVSQFWMNHTRASHNRLRDWKFFFLNLLASHGQFWNSKFSQGVKNLLIAWIIMEDLTDSYYSTKFLRNKFMYSLINKQILFCICCLNSQIMKEKTLLCLGDHNYCYFEINWICWHNLTNWILGVALGECWEF